jgi:D-alanine-D-alanine ligase
MTETSLLPMAAAKAGIDYDSLTERILQSALRRMKAAAG